jgi:hypothetical protein
MATLQIGAMASGDLHPSDWLRELALSVERFVAQGVAGGAVRGAAEELGAGVPDHFAGHLRSLLQDGLAILERLASEAAGSSGSPLATTSHAVAEGAVRGAVEEFRRLVPELQPATKEVLARVKVFLERSTLEAELRAQEIRAPGERMRIAAASAVAGATGQLSTSLPILAEPAADAALRVGRALVQGTAVEVRRQVQLALRHPLLRALLVGGAGAAVLLVMRRR